MERYTSISWLKHSVVLSDYRWHAMDKDDLISRSSRSFLKTLDVNWGPQSEMILSGSVMLTKTEGLLKQECL